MVDWVCGDDTDVSYEMDDCELDWENGRLHDEVANLKAEVARLVDENSSLKRQLDSAISQKKKCTSIIDIKSGPHKPVVLYQIVTTPSGEKLQDVQAPCRFSVSGAFPHAIVHDPNTNSRVYQLESRRPTDFKFCLRHKHDGSIASEHDVHPSGDVSFKLEIVYADNCSPVRCIDFNNGTKNLLFPDEKNIDTMKMVNGELLWRFRFNVSSSDTTPRNRRFAVRVYPVEMPECEDMQCFTVPFVVRAKVTAAADKQCLPPNVPTVD